MTQTKTGTQIRTGTPAGAASAAHRSAQACARRKSHKKQGNGRKATSHKPDTGLSDATIIDYLRHHQTVSVADLVDFTRVTATAVRQRLGRLMNQGLVARKTQHLHAAEQQAAGHLKRGRPTHRYSLTRAGCRSSGSNYEDLANVLWMEIRDIQDPEVRRGLLRKIVARLIEYYRDKVQGETLRERMNSLVALMDARSIPFEFDVNTDGTSLPGQPPTLTALACPYPDLAEQDRMICALEKMLFSEILGNEIKLTACRLDGDTCCRFEVHGALPVKNTKKESLYDPAMD